MTCDELPHIKYFCSLIILLELTYVSLLILTFERCRISLLMLGKEVISQNLIEQNDLVNKLHSFTFEP